MTDDLDTFEGWRKHHCYENDESEGRRAEFAVDMARREAARAQECFRSPPPPGEFRYAVAVEDDGVLRFVLVVCRRFKESKRLWECFVLMQRPPNPDPNEPDWDPHASYHGDGTYHQVSHGHKLMPQQRQPLNQFKGTEHLGSFQGLSWAVCNPANFTDVIRVPKGIITSMSGSVLVDLVEPGCEPGRHHREIPGQTITDVRTFTDCSPHVVIAIAKQDLQ